MANAPPPASPIPATTTIDPVFRSGTITAIGVILAFSLGFLNNWASQPTSWIPPDLSAVALIAAGIVFQMLALARMLAINSLEIPVYQRTVRIFLIGLVLVSLGVLLAIGGDALGYVRTLSKP